MRSYKAILCKEHNTVVVVDDDCDPYTLYEFLIEHRLCDLTFEPWTSSLDAEDNGFPCDIYTVL